MDRSDAFAADLLSIHQAAELIQAVVLATFPNVLYDAG